MVVRLRLTDRRNLWTKLVVRGDEDPLVVLKAILQANPTGWLDGYTNTNFSGAPKLVSIANIVTAELA